MRRCYIFRSGAILISTLILTLCIAAGVVAQDSDPKFVSAPEFILSADAVAAGIDGVFKVTLSVDDAGTVKNVRLYGDPMWPCGASPNRELGAVRTAVEAHLRLIKFSPSMKNGKPRSSDVILDFAIGEAFKRAKAAEEAKTGPSPKLVKGGVMNGRATQLVKPRAPKAQGNATVQVLIDEQGSVSKAGVLTGNALLFRSSREAACESKFSPTVIGGKAVQVTGVITYFYH